MDTKKNLIIDIAALVVYALAANPALTGIGAHEWMGLGVLLIVVVHVSLHGDWVVDALREVVRAPACRRSANLVLDMLLMIACMACIVSGLMMSGAVLPAFGYYADGYYFWDPLHALSAKVFLALLLTHLAVHARWVMRCFKKGSPKKGEGDGGNGRTEGR